jgi:transient receptor potential cation channel subfamily M member 3
LLKNYWQLELPKLIISVHGGISNFLLQIKLKKAIESGLIKVAETTDIWIITSGVDTGVVKHIGDILGEYYSKSSLHNIVLIGVCPWGVVKDKDTLIGCNVRITQSLILL